MPHTLRIATRMRLFVNTNQVKELDQSVSDGDTVHLICALSSG